MASYICRHVHREVYPIRVMEYKAGRGFGSQKTGSRTLQNGWCLLISAGFTKGHLCSLEESTNDFTCFSSRAFLSKWIHADLDILCFPVTQWPRRGNRDECVYKVWNLVTCSQLRNTPQANRFSPPLHFLPNFGFFPLLFILSRYYKNKFQKIHSMNDSKTVACNVSPKCYISLEKTA